MTTEPHFAVAVAFSQRFRGIVCEADRIARRFGARLSILHAGERSDEKVDHFRDAFARLGREEVDIYWCEGPSASEALIDAACSEYFDLFIAGTISRPDDARNFTGSIVRDLVSRTPCDLLLIPDPREEDPRETTACLLVEAHAPRWRAAKETLRALKPIRLEVIAADSPFAAARLATGAGLSTEGSLDEIARDLADVAEEIDIRRIRSNTGFVICDVIQDASPDFLLVESEWKNRRRVLPAHLGWLEQVIPSRLFLFGKPPREPQPGTMAIRL